MSCLIANWNLEWKRPNTAAGRSITALLEADKTDILCLTETSDDFLAHSHHGLHSEADYGYPITEGRRKVTLWSKEPWRDCITHLPDAPTGRFVVGTTAAPIDDLRVIGVCVPWKRAHVSTGRKDRSPWQDHISYLQALLNWPDVLSPSLPTLIMGDFNQTIPPRRAPKQAQGLLLELVAKFQPTLRISPERRMVCHGLASPELRIEALAELPVHDGDRKLSDHYGERLSVMARRLTAPCIRKIASYDRAAC